MTDSGGINIVEPSLPKGGSAFSGLSDSLRFDDFTGTVRMTVPVFTSEARGYAPDLSLQYNPSSGNGIFGMGFSLPAAGIFRKSSVAIPVYDDEKDTFLLDGIDLLRTCETRESHGIQMTVYRPRLETDFTQILSCKEDTNRYWILRLPDGAVWTLGRRRECQIADENAPDRIFAWLPDEKTDAKGNRVLYSYQADGSNRHLQSVRYGNYPLPDGTEGFSMEAVLNYGEYRSGIETAQKAGVDVYTPLDPPLVRNDILASYRSGFRVETTRLCQGVLMFHHLEDGPRLVRETRFEYEGEPALLQKVRSIGYRRRPDGSYALMEAPPLDLRYSTFEPEQCVPRPLRVEEDKSLPGWIGKTAYQPVDLYGEGIKGFLYTNDNTVFYLEPAGGGAYKKPAALGTFPIERDLRRSEYAMVSLTGSGKMDLMSKRISRSGYYSMGQQKTWNPYQNFPRYPNGITTPHAEYADLTGDGCPDMVVRQGQSLYFYPSRQYEGYGNPLSAPLPKDFPAAQTFGQSRYVGFLPMFGDGLEHRVQIENGCVACWPNLGYGNFGSRVDFKSPPVVQGLFDVSRLFFADTNGSGTTDLLYTYSDHVELFVNLGDRFAPPVSIPLPVGFSDMDEISFGDVGGNGIDSMLLSKHDCQKGVLHYAFDFTRGVKPYLLTFVSNNMGWENTVVYSSSIQYYLQDKANGHPWRSTAPFPVTVVESIRSHDLISGGVTLRRFRYRDATYHETKRAFAGFGYVEEQIGEHIQETYDSVPVLLKKWYDTGSGLPIPRDEYSQADPLAYRMPDDVYSAVHGPEAWNALEGKLRREETYTLTSEGQSLCGVTEQSFDIVEIIAPAAGSRGVYSVGVRESIQYDYSNSIANPAVRHEFTLERNPYGYPTRTAAVCYPSRDPEAYEGQKKTVVTASVEEVANLTGDYRLLGVSYHSRAYEIHGVLPDGLYFTYDKLQSGLETALNNIIPYGTCFARDAQARLYSCTKTVFWDEAQKEALPLGLLTPQALTHHTERAVFPQTYAGRYYGHLFSSEEELGHYLETKCGYHLGEDGCWWNRGLIASYGSRETFYALCKTESFAREDSPLFRRTQCEYDPYCLAAQKVCITADTQILETVGQLDYNTLSFASVTDVNGNVSQALYNPLGLPVAVSFGGITEGTHEGGGDLTDYTICENPDFYDVITRRDIYLQQASAYYYYDLGAFYERKQPTAFVTLERKDDGPARCSVLYRDGFSRDLEVKTESDDGFHTTGRILYNNQNLPVMQYEPFLSEYWAYEPQQSNLPAAVITYYDGLSRAIRVDIPRESPLSDGGAGVFFTRIERTPWQEVTYDCNDTVKDSEYYQTFLARYPEQPDQQLGDIMDALRKSEAGYQTPHTTVFDPCGLAIHDIGYSGTVLTRGYDINGQTVSERDARLQTDNFVYHLDMSGQAIQVDSVDAGGKTHLYDLYGNLIAGRDGKDLPVAFDYDRLNRKTATYITQPDSTPILIERLLYGDNCELSAAEARDKNLWGQLYAQYAASGLTFVRCRNIHGSILRKETTFCTEYAGPIDWSDPGSVPLQEESYTERHTYDSLNRLLSVTHPDGTVSSAVYNLSGQVSRVVYDDGERVYDIVGNAAYNPYGQKTAVSYGNGTSDAFVYDMYSHGLRKIVSQGKSGVFRSIGYSCDPAGNITRARDYTRKTVYRGNQAIAPYWDFTYDPYNRLIEARGRQLSPGADPTAIEEYCQQYTYDDSSNLTRLRHNAPSGCYTTDMPVAQDSNRLLFAGEHAIGYDPNGNMTNTENTPRLQWNNQNQLSGALIVDRPGDTADAEYYVHETSGTRVRKVTVRKVGEGILERTEILYIGSYEFKRVYRNDQLILKRHSAALLMGGEAVARYYRWEADDLGQETDTLNKSVFHYTYEDISGSTVFELNGDGDVLTREEYCPYGCTAVMTESSRRAADLKRFRFRGKERDSSTGLYCFGVRYYAPWLGRWISCDPAGTIDGLNLYRYASNNPVAFADPEGTNPKRRGQAAQGSSSSSSSSFCSSYSTTTTTTSSSSLSSAPSAPPAPPDMSSSSSSAPPAAGPYVPGGQPLRIGVLFRRDNYGIGHQTDRKAVKEANPNCDIVSIVHHQLFDVFKSTYHGKIGEFDYSMSLHDVDALFVPGGPASNPYECTKSEIHPIKHSKDPYEIARHHAEEGFISEALRYNIPILAVCGGSWRLARLLDARIEHFSTTDRRTHNGNMREVETPKHDVWVKGGTYLSQILHSSPSRMPQPDSPSTYIPGVNSSHWAQSIFRDESIAVTSAFAHSHAGAITPTTEAFEAHVTLYHYAIGIQWHPEYSPPDSMEANRRIVGSLGYAALERRAATLIQRVAKGFIQRMRDKREASAAARRAGALMKKASPASSPP